jgi:4-diphosphocytidyl-2-C-methyl-D-erythritol kinase
VIAFPNCKINLGLHVLRKREDGFHELDTVFYPVPWTDVIEIIRDEGTEPDIDFRSSGLHIYGSRDKNLCVRAYQLLEADHPLPPVRMHLHKILPIGAGLGGGSSDAAFVLKLLNELFRLRIAATKLESYAAILGSDCPFFIQNKPVRATGRGEIFEQVKVDLKGFHLVIVKPRVHVSTSEAYSGITPRAERESLRQIIRKPVAQWKDVLVNDFEASIFRKHPSVRKIKEQLYKLGAVYASMSGSGSAVFGLFNQSSDVHMHFRSATVWQGRL